MALEKNQIKDIKCLENVSKAPIQLPDPITRAAIINSFLCAFLRSFMHYKQVYISFKTHTYGLPW